jgi:hypothetical protein
VAITPMRLPLPDATAARARADDAGDIDIQAWRIAGSANAEAVLHARLRAT